jgi:type IV secretion system protein VirB6
MASAPAPEQGAAQAGDRRTVITQVSGGGIEPLGASQTSRARGIGSRFRASNDATSSHTASGNTGRAAAKETFK